jgi:hypothetical protein
VGLRAADRDRLRMRIPAVLDVRRHDTTFIVRKILDGAFKG